MTSNPTCFQKPLLLPLLRLLLLLLLQQLSLTAIQRSAQAETRPWRAAATLVAPWETKSNQTKEGEGEQEEEIGNPERRKFQSMPLELSPGPNAKGAHGQGLREVRL